MYDRPAKRRNKEDVMAAVPEDANYWLSCSYRVSRSQLSLQINGGRGSLVVMVMNSSLTYHGICVGLSSLRYFPKPNYVTVKMTSAPKQEMSVFIDTADEPISSTSYISQCSRQKIA
ncbi:hypothetical protein TNCV_2682401 [Trichonephila clavipes]|nr:hypothetical protein TNCV_2682401 [Trichonephila clavipes]